MRCHEPPAQRLSIRSRKIAGKTALAMLPLPFVTAIRPRSATATLPAPLTGLAPVNRHQRPPPLINPHEYHYVTFRHMPAPGIRHDANRQTALTQLRHTLVQRQQVAVLPAFIPRERICGNMGSFAPSTADFIAGQSLRHAGPNSQTTAMAGAPRLYPAGF